MYCKRFLCFAMASLLLILAGCSGSGVPDTPADPASQADSGSGAPAEGGLSGSFTVWFWDNAAITKGIDDFHAVYPDIAIQTVDVASADECSTKILSSLAAGTEMPDMGCIEIDYRYKMLNVDMWENLEQAPYNLDRGDMLDYLIPINTNAKGEIVSIDSLICTSAVGYKRPLAELYFGTSDYQELQDMFPTWQDLLDKGVELKEQYPDLYFFATDEDVFRTVFGQNSIPLEDETGDFSLDAFRDAVHWVYEFKNAGLINDYLMWTPGWYATFADDTHVFTGCPAWMPHFQIKDNDPDYEGRWGLMLPPGGGINWGGTAYAIYSGSEKKDLVWAYMQWALLSEEGANSYKAHNGFFSPYKPMYDDPNYYNQYTDVFGPEQNIGQLYYQDVLQTIQMRSLSEYDTPSRVGFNQWFQIYDTNKSMTEEELLQILEEEIRNNIA